MRWNDRRSVGWSADGHSIDDGVIFGLSSDEKPTQYVAEGTMFIEEDTRKIYLFDVTNSMWRIFAEVN